MGHGLKWTKHFKDRLRRIKPLHILYTFLFYVLPGFRIYSRLEKGHGGNNICSILSCAWKGIGDYYICGMYLEAWRKQENAERYIFLTPGGAEEMTLRLFPASEGHTLCVSKESVYHLFCFNTFLGDGRCGYQYLHHGKPHPAVNLTGMCFEGVNGLEMLDFYLYCGFRLPRETIPQQPVFSADSEKINRLMTDNNLESGKTVLLAPYSTGLADYLLPELFWTELAKGLTAHGFSACTNCSGDERPVEGTRRLFIPIREIVPFLDKSGYFISIRSGLCDVISTSKCKKIVIHTQTAKWWSDGMSLWYTGLNHMGLCSDVVELECRGDNWDELRDEIINTMLQELSM